MKLFPAGIGPIHLVRLLQFAVAIPVAWSFFVGIINTGWPDPILDLSQALGMSSSTARWSAFAVAVALEISEQAVRENETKFVSRLHGLLKSVGDAIRDGAATETAVASATQSGTGPEGLFREALEVAEDMPFDSALRAVADQSGRPYFQEVAYLVALAIDSPGDVGATIRALGGDLDRTNRLSETLTGQIYSATLLFKGTALLAVPPMFNLLTHTFAGSSITTGDVDADWAYYFFAYAAMTTVLIEGVVFDRWGSVPPRLPLALAIVYGGLSFMG